MRRRFARAALAALLALLAPIEAARALVEVERGRRAAGLWTFPSWSDPDRWLYLPNRARLALDDAGAPKFSFTFFVDDRPGESEDEVATIQRADGGAIVHLLATYDAPPETVAAAQTALREDLDDETIELAGPVIFDRARYAVVSSSLGDDPQGVHAGVAPALAGAELALSFRLEPDDAELLLGALGAATPDLSIVFELDFAGLTDAYRATMTIDWRKAQRSLAASLGGDVYVVSAQAETAIDRMLAEGAITLRVEGEDAAMDALVQHARDKALELMFAPIEASEVPKAQRGDVLSALAAAAAGLVGGASGRSSTPFSVGGAFRAKDLRAEGVTTLDFEKRIKVVRRSLATVDLSGLLRDFGDDPSRFRVVAVGGDPVFRQRRIFVGVDGALAPEFATFVDAVQVTVRKDHPDGTSTLRELRLTRDEAVADALHGPLVYGNAAGEAVESWRQFEYRSAWSFRGGGVYVAPWRETDVATLMIAAPYRRSDVFVDGDFAALESEGVRALVVTVTSDFFDQPHIARRRALIGRDASIDPIEVVLPEGEFAYDYEMLWIYGDGRRSRRCGRDETGFLFVEPPPEDDAPGGCSP